MAKKNRSRTVENRSAAAPGNLPLEIPVHVQASPLRAWLRSHGYSLFSSIGRLWRQPFTQLLTFGVLALALALPTMGHLALKNMRYLSAAAAQPGDVSLFLRPEIAQLSAAALQSRIQTDPLVKQVILKTPEEALAEFKQLTSFTDALNALDANPLPFVLVVELSRESLQSGRAMALVEALRGNPEVEIAQFDQEWLFRLKALLALAERAIWVFGGLLALTVLLVIGNTIRLELAARADEIQIMKLVGADNAFVRRPFLYSGFWFGAIAALLALLLVAGAVWLLTPAVSGLARSYGSEFRLLGLSLVESAFVFICGTVLGWSGALIAASAHMSAPENPQ
jgi:cell division transport system permease protein